METNGVGAQRTLQVIEDWFGEPVTDRLCDRVARMPADKARAYAEHLQEELADFRLPPKRPGENRPIVSSAFELKTSLLVTDAAYVLNPALPQQAISRISDDWDGGSSASLDISNGMRDLVRLRPLIEAGLVQLLPFSRADNTRATMEDLVDDPTLGVVAKGLFPENERGGCIELALREGDDRAIGWMEWAHDLMIAVPFRSFVDSLADIRLNADDRYLIDVLPTEAFWIDLAMLTVREFGNFYGSTEVPGGAERVYAALEELYGHDGEAAHGARLEMVLQTLLPNTAGLSYTDLVRMRSDSHQLAAFRARVRSGLRDIEAIPAASTDWHAQARECMNDALAEPRIHLGAELKKSGLLKNSLGGTQKFGIGVLAGGAAWAAGGKFGAAITSAAAGTAGSTLLDAVTAMRSRGVKRAIAAAYGVFDQAILGAEQTTALEEAEFEFF